MRRTIHQWRDWLLEYIGDDKYELIQKDNLSVFRTIMARNAMDAENECQLIIKNAKEKGEQHAQRTPEDAQLDSV